MAWNEPGSNNDKDPWTGKPKQSPPDLEAILRDLRKKIFATLNIKSNGNNGNTTSNNPPNKNATIGIAAGLIFAAWFLWGIFIVGPAEQAVILRFGKYVETVGPGPHWIPRFIESAYKINEQKILNYSYDSEMLTKDENIVSVAVAVQYRVGNARDFLFSATNPIESLQQATASALRQVIGHTPLEQVLTTGREKIRQEVQTQLTKILARYNTGLIITDVALQPAKAPEEVKEAFDDAIKAQEDEQRFENQAQAYAMQVEPIAKGQAQRLLADAKAYQQQAVLNAQAETTRFLALLPQYEKSAVVTRERLYLETLENVFSHNNKILIDSRGNSNMFYLPLDKLMQQMNEKPTIKTSATTNTTVPTVPATPPADTSNNARMSGGYE